MPTAVQDGSSLEFFVQVPALCFVAVQYFEASFVYVLINEHGHNQVRVVRQGWNVVQNHNEALLRGYLMCSPQQWFPTRIQYWISHYVKRRPNARYWRWSVRKQAQICYHPTEAPFHSDQRCNHVADAANEHIYGRVSSEVQQPARKDNDVKRCAMLRLNMEHLMRSILLNVAIVDPDANLLVPHPTACLKHLCRGRLLHSFISHATQPCPAQPAPVLPPNRGKTGGVLVLVLGCAQPAQDFV